jgi:hypothetical protein
MTVATPRRGLAPESLKPGSEREAAVTAAVKKEWCTLASIAFDHLTDEDRVIPTFEDLRQLAVYPRQCILQDGRTRGTLSPSDAFEFLLAIVCETTREALSISL